MTKFNAYRKMKELLTNYYIEAKTTREKPIAWITSGAPVEFLYAMDILPVYPENYAAMCAANHQSIELMEAAEAEGFSQDICPHRFRGRHCPGRSGRRSASSAFSAVLHQHLQNGDQMV